MRLLITAGPTREYLDDVRFLSNASSGRMGYAIAEAAARRGHDVVLVSGPVALPPPAGCTVHFVETTAEMLAVCLAQFDDCDGVVGAAAVCDYRPRNRSSGKLKKTGGPLTVELVETADVLAELGARKQHRFVMGFALEAQNARANALHKLHAKHCDAIVLNHPSAIGSDSNSVELIDRDGNAAAAWSADKRTIAESLMAWIEGHLAAR